MRKTPLAILLFVVLFATPIAAQTPASVTCPVGMTAGGAAGTYTATLTGPAPAGLMAIPDSSNPAVATVPAPFTIPTGAMTFTFQVTPVAAGSADVGVRVNGTRRDCTLTVAVAMVSPPTITNAPPPSGAVGVAYSFSYTSTGSPTFSVTAGGLPPGLSLSLAGVISGTPTTAGTFTGTVTASNGTAPAATQNFAIIISGVTIPTLSEWGMILLTMSMLALALLKIR